MLKSRMKILLAESTYSMILSAGLHTTPAAHGLAVSGNAEIPWWTPNIIAFGQSFEASFTTIYINPETPMKFYFINHFSYNSSPSFKRPFQILTITQDDVQRLLYQYSGSTSPAFDLSHCSSRTRGRAWAWVSWDPFTGCHCEVAWWSQVWRFRWSETWLLCRHMLASEPKHLFSQDPWPQGWLHT